VKANFVCSFTNCYPIDETEYKEKKDAYLRRYEDKKVNIGAHKKLKQLRDSLVLELVKKCDNQKQVCDVLHARYGYNLTPRSVRTILAEAREAGIAEKTY
jgi:hypothetical protein